MDQQVLLCLQGTLSPVESTRKDAEHQLRQLFYHPGKSTALQRSDITLNGGVIEAGLSLARILLSQDVDVAQRQMSSPFHEASSRQADSSVLCRSTAQAIR